MPSNFGDVHPLLDRSFWAEPLFKFAQVSRLVISLYDPQGHRICGPCFNQGLAARLARSGIWDVDGWGRQHERELVQRCVTEEETVYESILGLFGQLAVPCIHEGTVLMVLVLGWMPQHRPDSATLKDLAKKLAIPLEDIWHLIRMMPPVSADRLQSHGRMLDIFVKTLIHKLTLQRQTQREITGWRILSETAFALAGSAAEKDVCQITERALIGLLRDAEVVIELRAHGLTETSHLTAMRRPITIPIPGNQDQILGQIAITSDCSRSIEASLETLHALARLLGVALQESRPGDAPAPDVRRGHQAKSEFLAAVSHELKLPLHAIMGWAQSLHDAGKDSIPYHQALQTMERSSCQQSRLIEDLLDISRMSAGQIHLRCEEIDLVPRLHTTLDMLMPMIKLRQQTLHRRISSQPLSWHGDASRLHQVFWNLLSNASKFTQDHGHITVTLDEEGSWIRFEVTDSGQGMAAAAVERLFTDGLGLGLTIVRHLVGMHGGTVQVTSAGEGQGATFTVLLPRYGVSAWESQRLNGS